MRILIKVIFLALMPVALGTLGDVLLILCLLFLTARFYVRFYPKRKYPVYRQELIRLIVTFALTAILIVVFKKFPILN